ncbi:MAG: FHA domain-containing protein [Rubripirellula sp.]
MLVGRQAIIGYSEDTAIYIPDSRVHRNHARILYLSDGYWIENLTNAEQTSVNGQPISAGELVPLSPGMQIELSGVRLRFSNFEQLHMN